MRTLGIWLTLVVVTAPSTFAQSDVDVAMKFYLAGGAYCFRIAPEGVNLSEETEWTVMVLTGGSNRNNTFKIRTLDGGRTELSGRARADIGTAVSGVWRLDRSREEFFERFGTGIAAKTLRARVVKISPPGPAQLTPSARAEQYLKFSDRGSRVSFENVPDLTPDEFRQYAEYFPD